NGFLGPQSVWLGLVVMAVLVIGWRAVTPAPETDKTPVALRNIGTRPDAHIGKITRGACLAKEGRVWGTLAGWVECISYVSSPKVEGAEIALVYFGGDIPESQLAAASQDGAREGNQRRADAWAVQHGVPVVIVGRPGLMGSSGFHLLGGRRDEG